MSSYQPKTGQPCRCKPGKHRDNCPDCEGTGQRIDFAAIRAVTRLNWDDCSREELLWLSANGSYGQRLIAKRRLEETLDKIHNAAVSAECDCSRWTLDKDNRCVNCGRDTEKGEA
jgi:hypothetical protein